MRRFLLPLGLAAIFLSPCAFAQLSDGPAEPAGPLTLEAALSLVAAQSHVLTAAELNVDARAGGITQAALVPNPEISVDMEDTRRSDRKISGRLSIPVELGDKRAARVAAAQRSRDVAIAELAQVRANLRAATVANFFNVLIGQERVRLAATSADLAATAASVSARRVAAGKVAPLEETRARVEQSSAELEMTEATASLENARQRLAALWGNSNPAFTHVAGDIETLPSRPAADVLLQSLGEAPELAIERMEVERRKAMVGVERSKQYPDIRLTAGTQRNNELDRNQTLVGISIPLPLFNRNQGNLHEALVQADQAGERYAATQIRIRSELQHESTQLAVSRTSAQTLKTIVLPGATQAYDAARKGFEAGKTGFLDVLDSQRTLFQLRIRYLTVLANAYQAAIAIDLMLGR
jgi:cobalt-zinc-cadmium efflux system outer membrane protein